MLDQLDQLVGQRNNFGSLFFYCGNVETSSTNATRTNTARGECFISLGCTGKNERKTCMPAPRWYYSVVLLLLLMRAACSSSC